MVYIVIMHVFLQAAEQFSGTLATIAHPVAYQPDTLPADDNGGGNGPGEPTRENNVEPEKKKREKKIPS